MPTRSITRSQTTAAAAAAVVQGGSAFLALPFAVRKQTYHYAGLVTGKSIHLNYRPSRRYAAVDRLNNNADLSSLPLALFTVCRSINQELTRALYGENAFTVQRRGPRGFKPLLQLRNEAVASLRCLIVLVNLANQGRRKCANRFCNCTLGTFRSRAYDMPLDESRHSSHKAIITRWRELCNRLSSAETGKLSLYVICDCKRFETAQKIAVSLRSLPALDDCALRLSVEREDRLLKLAQDTVLLATRRQRPETPFQFLALPTEIQLMILRYTDLVSRYKLIYKAGKTRMIMRGSSRDRPCRTDGEAAVTNGFKQAVRFLCFCYNGHSAFSFRCIECKEGGNPAALFLVSRAFYQAAVATFYGSNHFKMEVISRVPENTHCLERFQHGPVLSMLRRLHLAYEGPGDENRRFYYRRATGRLADHLAERAAQRRITWQQTIDALLWNANLRRLDLEITFPPYLFHNHAPDDKVWWLKCQELIAPVTRLTGLRSFVCHLPMLANDYNDIELMHERKKKYEDRLEKMVMGPDYDRSQA